METRQIIAVIAFVLEAALLISLPFRLKFAKPENKRSLNKVEIIKNLSIYLLALALVFITLVRNFSVTSQVALCGCAVLATELGNREFFTKKEDSEEDNN